MPKLINKLRKSVNKNLPELEAFVTGRMPAFVYGKKKFTDIPVFCLHSANFRGFEDTLEFLRINCFRTLSGDDLLQRLNDPGYRNDGKEIVISFDDGMASLWTTVFPLLQKYNTSVIAFVLPALTRESEQCGPTIFSESSEKAREAKEREGSGETLCNWAELRAMHDSGLVDIQSHGMLHGMISVGPKIIDFVRPDIDSGVFDHTHIPLYLEDGKQTRDPVWGHPIYEHQPRLAGLPGYFDDTTVRAECSQYVMAKGGEDFFSRSDWRTQLQNVARSSSTPHADAQYESPEDIERAMRFELAESKRVLEETLPHKTVRHFCFPWFRASDHAAQLASECGYESIFLGATPGFTGISRGQRPKNVLRLQEEFLPALPGERSLGKLHPLKSKLRHFRGNESRTGTDNLRDR